MKNERTKRSFLLSLVVLACAAEVRGQVVSVEPQKPRYEDTLVVTYDPRGESAALKAGDDVYVIVGTYYTYGLDGFIAKMGKEGGVFRYKFPVAQPLSAVKFNFFTLRGWREKNYYNTLIYRPDGEPVRGGYQSRIQSRGYREMAAKELAPYPDNYAAYLEKWRLAGLQDRDKQLSLVQEDMARLEAMSAPSSPCGGATQRRSSGSSSFMLAPRPAVL